VGDYDEAFSLCERLLASQFSCLTATTTTTTTTAAAAAAADNDDVLSLYWVIASAAAASPQISTDRRQQVVKAYKTVVSSNKVDAEERRTCLERLCQVSSF